ncbi:MAG: dihydroneopterin aldolase [Candidatus Eisenbacteria bacterium]|nr:dihydroneopterin aldolase [Candidatus Eisenbacteria bacterium]
MDVIRLRDVVVFPKLGVADFEKESVQKVTLDVELHLDLQQAGATDDVARTVDYQRVYRRIREVADEQKFHLIEALAGSIARTILEEFPVQKTVVRVRKTNLPFDAHLNCVEVEIERRA